MKIRPISFKPFMVSALLDGTKIQSRRALKQPKRKDGAKLIPELLQQIGIGKACPYGEPGDQLWVREPWRVREDMDTLKPSEIIPGTRVVYETEGHLCFGKLRKSIFMPRWASRLLLEIDSLKIERLNDITEHDAKKEGVKLYKHIPGKISPAAYMDYRRPNSENNFFDSARGSYFSLWESINGDGQWGENPWVWVINFRRV